MEQLTQRPARAETLLRSKNVISDINNFITGKDAVKIAKDRVQPIYKPADTNSPDVFGPGDKTGKTKGTVNPVSSR